MAKHRRSFIDRALGAIGLQRAKRGNESYTGGANNRFMLDWIRQPLSADKELEGTRLQLVARSRDLTRNNAYGRRFVKMSQHHDVGFAGIKLRAINAMANGKPLDKINDAVESAWREWSKPKHCSTNKRLSWLEIQRLCVAEWKQAGAFLCQMVTDRDNPFGFSLHPIDYDRLDDQYNVKASPTQNEIRAGIELDSIGTEIAFHILRSHPSDNTMTARSNYRDRIPAEDIIHVYQRDERVDLSRGIPQMAVAMRDLRHLDQAQEAAIIALRAAAANPLFIETAAVDGAEVEVPEEDIYVDGEPGSAMALGLGQKVNAPQMSQPRDTHPALVKCFVRTVASGLGVSYNQLANDLEGVNLSSLRVGRHEEQETWMAEQEMLVTHLCEPVFERWIKTALLKGKIAGADYDLERVNKVEWHPRRWQSVDPLQDVQTHEKKIALGLDSRTEIKAREGGDLWETWANLAEESEYAMELDLDVEPPRTSAGGQPMENDEDGNPKPAKAGDGKPRDLFRLMRGIP